MQDAPAAGSRRVLVTGAGGFVGRHVVPELLQRRYDVHCLCHHRPGDLPAGVAVHQADLLAPAGRPTCSPPCGRAICCISPGT